MPDTIERELVELERRYWQALKEKDVAAAVELTDEPCIVAGAQGVGLIDHAGYVRMMEHATWTILDFTVGDDVHVGRLATTRPSSPTRCTSSSRSTAMGSRSARPTPRPGCAAPAAGCARLTPSRSPATRWGASAERVRARVTAPSQLGGATRASGTGVARIPIAKRGRRLEFRRIGGRFLRNS